MDGPLSGIDEKSQCQWKRGYCLQQAIQNRFLQSTILISPTSNYTTIFNHLSIDNLIFFINRLPLPLADFQRISYIENNALLIDVVTGFTPEIPDKHIMLYN